MGRIVEQSWKDLGITGISGNRDVNISTVCPRCSALRKPGNRKKRCLSVNPGKGVWNCHHCGWSGTLKRIEPSGPSRTDEITGELEVTPWEGEETPLDSRLVDWLGSRRISEDTARRMGVSLQCKFIPAESAEVECAAFPYVERGQVVNCKYRSGRKNFVMIKGKRRPLYNVDALVPGKDAILVEGELDVLSLLEVGYERVVTIPSGADSSEALADCEEAVKGVSSWIVAVDSDQKGYRLEREATRRLGRDKCRIVRWPAECNDANDVLKKHGRADLRRHIEAAEWYPMQGLVRGDELRNAASAKFLHGYEPTLKTMWCDLDEIYGVRQGTFTIVTGIPSHGKSTFMDCLMLRMAELHGWRWCVYSPESGEPSDHVNGLVEKYVNMPLRHTLTVPAMNREHYEAGLDWIGARFNWIECNENEDRFDVGWLLEKARASVLRHGINGFVVDPWNEVEVSPGGISEHKADGKALRLIRQFAKRHDVAVFIVAHPRKQEKTEAGTYAVPGLYDVNGTADFYNRADIGLTVWRDTREQAPDKTTLVKVTKSRNRRDARLGSVRLTYDPVCATYGDVAPADNVVSWTDSSEGYGDD